VDGYTDNVKGQVDNTKLSKDRAQVIGKRVKKALPGVKITVKGHGEKNPVADNKTERGKEANRRVEITAKG
jgi:OOP family OmpA-OmpF porin